MFWKWIERAEATRSLLVAAFGGAGMIWALQTLMVAFGQPNPPWWVPGLAAALCGAIVWRLLRYQRREESIQFLSSNRAHGVIGDFVDVTIEHAEYGSDQYRSDCTQGLIHLLNNEQSKRPDGAVSIGVTTRGLIGRDDFLDGVYKHVKVTFSMKLHEGKELTIRPGERLIRREA